MSRNGKLILVVGPSGSGKGTLIEHVRKLEPEIIIPVCCTTRTPRPGDQNGREFYFLEEAEFKRQIAAGDFLEWAYYGGNYYGTPKSEVLPSLTQGEVILLELSAQAVPQIREAIPQEQRVLIFIDAGPWKDLEHRILARAPITELELEKRKNSYSDELKLKEEADIVISNFDGSLERAKEVFTGAISELCGK